ncbi:MAG: cell wall hydrolase [Thermoanaerobacterales bacterium]|nr:cell wall hydrolase [Thermoanaerobacterales bacterium]
MRGIFVRLLVLTLFPVFISLGAAVHYAGAAAGSTYYTVKDGDTLWDIGRRYRVAPNVLAMTNGVRGHLIFPGQVLTIPSGGWMDGVEPASAGPAGGFTPEDVMLLARAIHAEARGESFTGKVAVGAVILNRVASPFFPKSLQEVIFERTHQVYQFSPVADGSIHLPPDEEAIRAALAALSGQDPTGGALFFYNPKTAQDCWIRTLPVITQIGNHVFCR